MNKVVKYKWQEQDMTLTFEDVKNLIATAPNVTDKEIILFMKLCQYRGLNPFIKEAYLIKYGNEPAKQVVSKDVMDARVEVDERYDGEEITHNYERGMDLNKFWMRGKIYRKGCSHPVADVTVYYSEYVGKKKDGTITKMWSTKEFTMLQKVCKAQMKRESNPRDLAGMYLAEELDQEVKPTEEEIKSINPISNKLATQPQVDLIEKQIVGSHLFDPGKKIKDQSIIGLLKNGMTKTKASEIINWWLGDSKKSITGERTKRETKEKEAKGTTKTDKIKETHEIASDKPIM